MVFNPLQKKDSAESNSTENTATDSAPEVETDESAPFVKRYRKLIIVGCVVFNAYLAAWGLHSLTKVESDPNTQYSERSFDVEKIRTRYTYSKFSW